MNEPRMLHIPDGDTMFYIQNVNTACVVTRIDFTHSDMNPINYMKRPDIDVFIARLSWLLELAENRMHELRYGKENP